MFYLNEYVRWQSNKLSLYGVETFTVARADTMQMAVEAYRLLGLSYPKFFKMDVLSKAAYVAAELLNRQYSPRSKPTDIGIMLSTTTGCISVDKKFDESRYDVASPALFVYTLPNIMLGELSIRFGYKGEQLCTPVLNYDLGAQLVLAEILLQTTETKEILMGYVNADDDEIDLLMFWVNKDNISEYRENQDAFTVSNTREAI